MIEIIQLSNERAKLSDWMKATSEMLPITPATRLMTQRLTRRSSESADSDAE
jgi:hypothetical protein